MEAVFLKVLNNGIAAGWLILAVLLARLLLKNAPKNIRCALWALVGLRLVLPVRLESSFSLVPSAVTVDGSIMLSKSPAINSGIPLLDRAVNPTITASFAPSPAASANPLQILVYVASILWLAGMGVMLLYSAVSFLCLRRKVAESVPLRDNIRLGGKIPSPFVLGMVRPRIYLPFGMEEENRELVIAHEQAHIKRRDNLTKPLSFLLLSVYWFHPLLWLAYVLLCRDMELACDERVLKEKGSGIKKEYSYALLACSVPHRLLSVCPVAFGEVGVKQRIKSVLNYKKPALWLTVAAVLLVVILALGFLTDPAGLRFDMEKNPVVSARSVDLRLSEAFEREMNQAQLEEFTSTRLPLLKGTRKSGEYEGLTPYYYISAVFQDGSTAKINGYSKDVNMVDIEYKGERYVVEDEDFADYVNRFCIGGDLAEAENWQLRGLLEEAERQQKPLVENVNPDHAPEEHLLRRSPAGEKQDAPQGEPIKARALVSSEGLTTPVVVVWYCGGTEPPSPTPASSDVSACTVYTARR